MLKILVLKILVLKILVLKIISVKRCDPQISWSQAKDPTTITEKILTKAEIKDVSINLPRTYDTSAKSVDKHTIKLRGLSKRNLDKPQLYQLGPGM